MGDIATPDDARTSGEPRAEATLASAPATCDHGIRRELLARSAGDYRRARDRALQLIGRGARSEMAGVLVALARLQEDLGDLGAASEAIEAALGILAELPSCAWADAVTAMALSRRAGLHRAAWRHTAAGADVQRALTLAHASMAPGDPRMPAVLVEAGRLAHDLSRFDEAHTAMSRAVAAAESVTGPERDGARALALEGLGAVEREKGHYARAFELFESALQLAARSFGPESLEVVLILNDLGITGKYAGRFDDSERYYADALSMLEAAVGDIHPDVSALHHSIGGLAHARGDFARAEQHARRSVQIRMLACGPDDPTLTLDRAALAAILEATGKREEAQEILREVIPALEKAFGPANRELAVSLNNLAALRYRAGDRAEAIDLYRRALAVKEAVLGPDAPELAATLNNLAVALKSDGDFASAAALYRRALAILQAGVEPSHPTVAKCRRNIAAAEAALARTTSPAPDAEPEQTS